jgi:hypothetical protein
MLDRLRFFILPGMLLLKQDKQGNMKNHYPFLAVLALLILFACLAGCSSKEIAQREPIERPSLTQTNPASDAEHTVSQNARGTPKPSITRPQVSSGSTIPAPGGTIGSMVYENASEIMVTAQEISSTWDPNGLTCNEKSCTAGFVNNNGDSVQVLTTLYDSTNSAKAFYDGEKQKDSAYRIIPLEIPDESYGWVQKSQSSVVFHKNNAVVIVDYKTSSGPASITTVKEFAGAYSQNL